MTDAITAWWTSSDKYLFSYLTNTNRQCLPNMTLIVTFLTSKQSDLGSTKELKFYWWQYPALSTPSSHLVFREPLQPAAAIQNGKILWWDFRRPPAERSASRLSNPQRGVSALAGSAEKENPDQKQTSSARWGHKHNYSPLLTVCRLANRRSDTCQYCSFYSWGQSFSNALQFNWQVRTLVWLELLIIVPLLNLLN